MPFSNLDDIPSKTGLLVFLFGIIGAIINYKRRKEATLTKRVFMFLSDMISSVMLSIASFSVVIGFGGNELLAVGLAGFVAHQGTRAVYLIELGLSKKYKLGIDEEIRETL